MPRKSKKMPTANIYDRSLSNTWQLHRTITLLQKAEEMNRRKITRTTMNNNTEKRKKKNQTHVGWKLKGGCTNSSRGCADPVFLKVDETGENWKESPCNLEHRYNENGIKHGQPIVQPCHLHHHPMQVLS